MNSKDEGLLNALNPNWCIRCWIMTQNKIKICLKKMSPTNRFQWRRWFPQHLNYFGTSCEAIYCTGAMCSNNSNRGKGPANLSSRLRSSPAAEKLLVDTHHCCRLASMRGQMMMKMLVLHPSWNAQSTWIAILNVPKFLIHLIN